MTVEGGSRARDLTLEEIEVIIPNLKRRYSGGTAVNRTIAPLIAKRCRAVWLGPDRPDGIAGLSLADLVRLRFRPPKGRAVRIWHARRNTEMLLGLVLKRLGWRLALIFNSASQRRKSRYTDFLIARMDEVIATSETSASFVLRDATVVHHGVDLETYRPPADRAAVFAAAGLPGKYGVGTFGRVRRQKGSDLFVAAMCRLLPKYPDFSAVVVGHVSVDNLPFVEKLKQEIAAAGLVERIRFLGELPIEEVPLWYQRISIYVFASRVEGFGLTMLEADGVGRRRGCDARRGRGDGDRRRRHRGPRADRRHRGAGRSDRTPDARPRAHGADGGKGAGAGGGRFQPRPGGRRHHRRLSPAVESFRSVTVAWRRHRENASTGRDPVERRPDIRPSEGARAGGRADEGCAAERARPSRRHFRARIETFQAACGAVSGRSAGGARATLAPAHSRRARQASAAERPRSSVARDFRRPAAISAPAFRGRTRRLRRIVAASSAARRARTLAPAFRGRTRRLSPGRAPEPSAPFPGADSEPFQPLAAPFPAEQPRIEREAVLLFETGRVGEDSPPAGGKSMIAVELAHDFHHTVDGAKIGPRHGAVGDQKRLVEAAHLQRDELGRRLGHAAGKNLGNERAHALFRHVLPRRDLGDRNAAVQKVDDPTFPPGLGEARRTAGLDRPVAKRSGRNGFC